MTEPGHEPRVRLPLDNVQRFERRRTDIDYLQMVADLGEADKVTLDELLEGLQDAALAGLHVGARDGRVEVVAFDVEKGQEELQYHQLMEGDEIRGRYIGLEWREGYDLRFGPDDMGMKLCHKISQGEETQTHTSGDESIYRRYRYVTAADTNITLTGFEGSHSFDELKGDGFLADVDADIVDGKSLEDILMRLSVMFGNVFQAAKPNLDASLNRQRISYLNGIGVFTDARCVATYGYLRQDEADHENYQLITREGGLAGYVQAIGLDYALITDDAGMIVVDHDVLVISLEVDIPDLGVCSVPVNSATNPIKFYE